MTTTPDSALAHARANLRASGRPAVLLRTVGAGLPAVLGAPLVVAVGLLLLSATGDYATGSSTSALMRSLAANAIVVLASTVALVLGVLTVAALHGQAHRGERTRVRTATARALAALPRLAAALTLLAVGLAVALLAWAPLVALALGTAAVRWVQHRRSAPAERVASGLPPKVRQALVWAIPFLPLVTVVALMVASVAASLSAPGSVVGLLRLAVARVRTDKRSLLLLVAFVVPASAGLTWVTVAAATAVQGDTTGAVIASDSTSAAVALGTLVLGAGLVVLMGVVGAAVAVLTPSDAAARPTGGPTTSASPAASGTLGPLRRRNASLARTAMVVIVALGASLTATSASATAPLAMAPGDLLVPEVRLVVEGSGPAPSLTASITVADGDAGGTVQFIVDDQAYGVPVPVLVAPDSGAHSGGAILDPPVNLAAGNHTLSVGFTPSSALVAPGTAAPVSYVVAGGPWTPRITATVADVGGAPQLQATVSVFGANTPGGGDARGTVQFFVDDVAFGTPVGLVSGGDGNSYTHAERPLTPALAPGVYRIKAVFSPSSTDTLAGTSSSVSYEVFAAPTLTPTLTLALQPGVTSARPQLSAMVRVVDGDPAGSVQFLDGTAPIGGVIALQELVGQRGTFGAWLDPTPLLAPGIHDFTFRYTPSSPVVAPGTSAAVTHTVKLPTTTRISAPVGARVGEPARIVVTVTPSPAGSTALVPDGEVLVGSGATYVYLPLVDGAATWDVAALPTRTVRADFQGSTEFDPSSVSADVAPDVPIVATAMTVDLPDVTDANVAADLHATVALTAPDAPTTVVTGGVQAFWGGVLLTEGTLLDGVVDLAVPTASLPVGAVDLRFVYVQALGFGPAAVEETVTLAAAVTGVAIVAVPDAGPVGWGDPHHLTVTVTSALDGPRTLELREPTALGHRVLRTVPLFVVGGSAVVPLDLTRALLPGASTLTAVVLATGRSAEGTSPDVTVQVDPATSTTALSPTDSGGAALGSGLVGEPITLTAEVRSPIAGTPPVGTVQFLADGVPVASVMLDGAGRASATFTPTRRSTAVLTARYADSPVTTRWASSAGTWSVVIAGTPATAPVAAWSGTFTPDDTHLRLTYAPAAGGPTPTGTVEIVTADGTVLTTGTLSQGVFDQLVPITGGSPVLTARYLGDGRYADRSDTLPATLVTPWTPSATLTSYQTTVNFAEMFHLNVAVDGVPLTLVRSVNVIAVDPTGVRSTAGTVSLTSNGTGYLELFPYRPGVHTYVVEVAFVAGADLATTTSAPVAVTVGPVPVPRLTLEVAPQTYPTGGFPLDLVVTAADLPTGGTGLAVGDTVVLHAADGSVLATTTLTVLNGQLRGHLRTAALDAGTYALTASAGYGPFGQTTTSPELSVVVVPAAMSLSAQVDPVVVGGNARVNLSVSVDTRLPSQTLLLPVTVSFEGWVQTVMLTRRAGGDPFADPNGAVFVGSTIAYTTHAGLRTLHMSTAGDGLQIGAGAKDFVVTVDKKATSVQFIPQGVMAAATPLTVWARALSDGPAALAPTGTIRITIESTGGSCLAPVGGECTIDAARVPAGLQRIVSTYLGDDENLSSEWGAVVAISPRSSRLVATYSPTPDKWVTGEPVTVSWATTTTGLPAKGTVVASFGGPTCSGPAVAGSCTVTLAQTPGGPAGWFGYSVEFFPTDDAPRARVDGGVTPATCIVTAVPRGTVEVVTGTPCRRGTEPGVMYGGTVRVTTAPLATGHVVTTWTIGGNLVSTSPDPSYTFRPSGAGAVEYTDAYAPACFTLSVGPTKYESTMRWGKDGTWAVLSVLTPPNCHDPRTPTAADREALKYGQPQYAAGTVVTLRADSLDYGPRSVAAPWLALDTLRGATPVPGQPGLSTVVMDADRNVYATFRVDDCVRPALDTIVGGTLTIEKSVRPSSTKYLEPASGACTAHDGSAGFVRGTQLTLKAAGTDGTTFLYFTRAGKNDGYVHQLDATGAETIDRAGRQDIVAFGAVPTNLPPATYTSAVEDLNGLGAKFGEIRCVAVHTVSSAPTSAYGSVIDFSHGPSCSSQPSTSTTTIAGSYTIRDRTDWYIASGGLATSTKYPLVNFTGVGPRGQATPVWSTSEGLVEYPDRWDRRGLAGTRGPYVDLEAGAEITIFLNFRPDSCTAPVVNLPQGGSYGFTSASPDPFCMEGLMSKNQRATLIGDSSVSTPLLIPIFSTPNPRVADLSNARAASDGRWYSVRTVDVNTFWGHAGDELTWDLEYCASLDLTVRVRDGAGDYSVLTDDEAAALVADDGGCAPLYARPGRTAKVSLSPDGSYSYTIVAGTTAPVRTVDAVGNLVGTGSLDLQVTCYGVSTGERVYVVTAGNCPGDSSRFTKGTVVEVQVAPNSDERMDGWYGGAVDGEYGDRAWVVVDRDRSVNADIHHPKWDEVLANGFSSFTQRVISVGGMVLTSMVMAQSYVAQAAVTAMKYTTAAIRALGYDGKVLDAIDTAARVITAEMQALQVAAGCLAGWAEGKHVTAQLADALPTTTGTDPADKVKAALEAALKKRGNAATPGGAAGIAQNLVNAFGSNLGMYGQDARKSWENFAPQVGQCIQDGLKGSAATI